MRQQAVARFAAGSFTRLGVAPVSGGEPELAALEQAPADERRALALAEVLVARADADGGFREALQAWWEQARQVQAGGNVTNSISGGNQYGPVLQGQNFSGLTFGPPAVPPPAAPTPDLDAL